MTGIEFPVDRALTVLFIMIFEKVIDKVVTDNCFTIGPFSIFISVKWLSDEIQIIVNRIGAESLS